MKTFTGKFVAVFLSVVMLFNQYGPAYALQQPLADQADDSSADAPAPNLVREMGKRAAKPIMYDRPAAPEPEKPAIELSAKPEFITGNDTVTINWAITGDLPADASPVLQISFPTDYTPTAVSPNTYDAQTQTLSIPITKATQGDFTLDIQNPLDEAIFQVTLLDTTQKTSSTDSTKAPSTGSGQASTDTEEKPSTGSPTPSVLATDEEQVLATGSLSLPKHEKFDAKKPSTGSGTLISAEEGRIKVQFGKNSLPEDATINIGAPAGDAVPVYSLSGHPFEIDAQGVTSKKELHQFAEEVAIDLDYSMLDLQGKNENDLFVYYYNPDTNDWYALPSHADPKTKTLHAITTHFTVFDMGFNNWQASHLPTLDGFQVSTFTGAGTYSMPIEVPAGPGGLQPSLNLSYNSQVIDQSTSQTQASWVGMGWSLETGSIQLNTQGTPYSTEDNTWMLNVAGISTTIVKTSTGYSAADENFMKFSFNGDNTWTVLDKQGNTYYFEKPVNAAYDNCNGSLQLQTHGWLLTRVKNIFDKVLTYNYVDETKQMVPTYNKDNNGCVPYVGAQEMITASYPDTIVYPGGHYRVRFQREPRADYMGSWAGDAAYHSFERSRLLEIFVEQDENLDNSWNIIRKYHFDYANDAVTSGPAAPLWPGVVWNNGTGRTTTLLKVHQFGVGGANELPTATFRYDGDYMHLNHADNGYGGSIDFTYENWYYNENNNRAPASQTTDQSFNDVGCSGNIGGFIPFGWGSDVQCQVYGGGIRALKMYGTALNTGFLPIDRIRPGGSYKFTPWLSSDTGAVTINYGLSNGQNDIAYSNADDVVILPTGASRTDVILRSTAVSNSPPGQYAVFRSLKVQLLTSIYRVITRKISDGAHTPDTYTYSYSGATVNDSAHSQSACTDAALNASTCQQYIEKYSEFRGHSQVIETTPDGQVTITTFNQSDDLKGRPSDVTIKDLNSGKKLRQQVLNYNSINLTMTQLIGGPNSWGYSDGDFHYWVSTASEENYIYGSDEISYNASRTYYVYDGATCDANQANCTYTLYTVAYGNGNLTAKIESSWNGTTWSKYRTTNSAYIPNVTDPLHLTGFPASQWITDASGAILAQTLYIYDDNITWNASPQKGKLSAVRTWVDGIDYSQVSYGYDDGWGNRTSTSVYKTYGTAEYGPTSAAITQRTGFDDIYHTYPIWQKTPAVGSYTDGFTTSFSYDYTLGLPITQIDANGVPTTVQYDSFGRLTKVIKDGDTVGSPTLQVVYYDNAQPFKIELRQKIDDTHGYFMRHTYDGMGRETMTQTGNTGWDSAFTTYSTVDYETYFSGNQRVSKQSAPYNPNSPYNESPVYTTTTFDALGRPLTITTPDTPNSNITSYHYNGLTTTVTDANGHTTRSDADVWGNTKSVTPPTGPGITYTYTTLGQLTKATRNGLDTTIHYDKAGRKTDMDDPDMGQWYYKYDALGNLTTQVDAKNQATNLYYDVLNRLKGKTYVTGLTNGPTYLTPPDPGSYPVSYTYDVGGQTAHAIGRRTRMDDASGLTLWTYDTRGRVTSESKNIIGAGTFTTNTAYNSADLPIQVTYPVYAPVDGATATPETIINTYNAQMRLDTVVGADPYVTDTIYDSAGRVKLRTLGNSNQTTYTYYPWNQQGGRLRWLQSGSDSGHPASFQNITYNYDDVGNIASIKDTVSAQTQFFDYDALDRLTNAKACTVDAGGNCTNPVNGTGLTVLAGGLYNNGYNYNGTSGNLTYKAGVNLYYDDVNHAHAVTSTSAGDSFTYDTNGNQTQRTVNGQTYNLSYDVDGHLVSVASLNQQDDVPAASPTVTTTPTKSQTPTVTATPTKSQTPTVTATQPTVTATPTVTKTPTITATPTLTQPASPTPTATPTVFSPALSWNFDTTVEGWYANASHISGFAWQSGGTVGGTIIGTDPQIYSAANLNQDITNSKIIKIRYKNSTSSTSAQLFFITAADSTWGGSKVITFNPAANSDYTDYTLDMSVSGVTGWTGTLSQLRFDPAGSSSGSFSVDYIKIGSYAAPTATPTKTLTPVASATKTVTPTVTKTATPIASPSGTITKTATATNTPPPAPFHSAIFTYDADGQMVKAVFSPITGAPSTTYYVSGAYQIKDGVVTKFYPGGAFRVDGVLYYGFGDHLGSSSITTDDSGAKIAETRYKAWGEIRYQSGDMHTDKGYTGQRSYVDDFGLQYYNARWYDSGTGRFAQADTIIPGGVQGYDRYAYVNNSPVNSTDSTGHYTDCNSLSNTAKSACQSANQQEHQNAYDKAINKLGQKPDGLDQWSSADLYRLIGWLNRGIKFDMSNKPGNAWTGDNLKDVVDGLDYAQSYLGDETDEALGLSNGGSLTISREIAGNSIGQQGGSAGPSNLHMTLTLLPSSNPYAVFTVLHEIGHFVDYNLGVKEVGNSPGWRDAAKWSHPWWQFWDPAALTTNDLGTVRDYGTNGPGEDFADTFAWITDPYAGAIPGKTFNQPSKDRLKYFANTFGH